MEAIFVDEILGLLLLLISWFYGMPVGLAVIAAICHCFELRLRNFGVMGEFHPVLNFHLLD